MLCKLYSGTVIGLAGVLIEVEVDVANRGFPIFAIVGLPSKSVDEAKDRVRTAIVNSSYEMPDSRITVNLAPADIPKIGSGFDLPIALGVLAASGKISKDFSPTSLFIGELSLYGELRSVPGVVSICIMAKEKGIQQIFLPKENAAAAAVIEGMEIIPVERLSDLIDHLNGEEGGKKLIVYHDEERVAQSPIFEFDFVDIKGQEQAKRALQIAAAGFHNVHLRGVPGAGKTMLCRAFPSILPPLEPSEVLEVSKIYSAVGLLKDVLSIERPFRSPHHTTSRIGLIGGGAAPTPGEISLAHRGVLFLDELPEFPRSTIEALRQPLEDGFISISRASGSMTFPCRFLLLAASNPCPCGYYRHPRKKCTCMPGARNFYRKKISGPLLDRIDIHVDIWPVDEEKLTQYVASESSTEIRQKVIKAQLRQKNRFEGTSITNNNEMTAAQTRLFCHLTDGAESSLKNAVGKLNLSARFYFKIIKLAQTIADLDEKEVIEEQHVAEAIQYRYKEE